MSKIVLCVDDSVTMQQVADITFRGTEFTYVSARSYDEALDKAKSQKPTVVLADSSLGSGKSGYDLCLALKSADATANVPVVILVGNGAPYDNAKGVQVGADANLPKPWDTQTMLEKVIEVVTKAATGVAKPGQASAAAGPTTPKPAPAKPPTTPPEPANQPPRSATIMGMPTIKMPGSVAPIATAVPAKTTVMAVPPISQSGEMIAPAPQMTTPGPTAPVMRAPAKPVASTAAPAAAVAVAPALNISSNRAPMISGSATKRSAIVERALATMGARLAEASGLPANSPELAALLKLSTEVVERIVWEVVPDLAEQIIRENLADLTARRS